MIVFFSDLSSFRSSSLRSILLTCARTVSPLSNPSAICFPFLELVNAVSFGYRIFN